MGDKSIGKTDQAWIDILKKYPIEEKTKKGEFYFLKSSEINEFRESRLMTKFDTSESVSKPLKDLGLNVLPVSRKMYVLGKFNLYQPFPDVSGLKPTQISLPKYETLQVENLTSESNAINALLASRTLEDFLGEQETDLVQTFNGRMGSEEFSFDINFAVDSGPAIRKTIKVDRAQIEIDAGLESQLSVSIMEAKNIRHDDFNIRQLYFPYRRYFKTVSKPIRLIFSQYTNLTYYLYEYRFANPEIFSSIELVNQQAYTFEDSRISMEDLVEVWKRTKPVFDDNKEEADVPFIQADRFDRVISITERLGAEFENSMSMDDIAIFMGTVKRQASYYSAAGEYLTLFDRSQSGVVKLTDKARKILKMNYRDRQLAYAGLCFEHDIFYRLFRDVQSAGEIPDRRHVEKIMLELNVCNGETTLGRRASSVISWLSWIFSLVDD
ncbi:type II restriction enzyme [Dermabacteraceae bacterium P13088]